MRSCVDQGTIHQLSQLTSLRVAGFVPRLQLSKPATHTSQHGPSTTGVAAAASISCAAAGTSGDGGSRERCPHGDSSSSDSGSSDSGSSSSSSSMAGTRQPLPLLQELHLSDFTVSHTSTLLSLTHLQSVTQLKIGTLQRPIWYCSHPPDETPFLCDLLSSLTRLQHLVVTSTELELEAFLALNSSSLTRLEMQSRRCGEPQYDDRPPCISTGHPLPQLARIQVLDIAQCRIDASVLACMPQLQELKLSECGLCLGWPYEDRTEYSEDSEADDPEDRGHLNPEEVLLTTLAQLQHLRRLELLWTHIPSLRAGNLALYAGLTASSHLSKLRIVSDSEPPWRLGGVQYVFPTGRQLQRLKELHLVKSLHLYSGIKDDFHSGWCLDAKGLQSIISECTALTSLTISNVLQPGDVEPLLGLPASCVELKVGGKAFDDSAVKVVRQLTQLVDLTWDDAPSITLEGMAQLTAVTALTKLLVNHGLEDHRRHYWESDDEWRKDKYSRWRDSPFVTLKIEEGYSYRNRTTYTVWEQLQKRVVGEDRGVDLKFDFSLSDSDSYDSDFW